MISLVAVFLSVLDIIKKRSKYIFVFTVFFLWTLMAFVYGDADTVVYESRYANPNQWKGQTELLFGLTITLASKLGLSFLQYRACIAGIILILISCTVYKYAIYPNFVLILYFIIPFALNATQLRNALATSVFIFGLRYLMDEESRKVKIYRSVYIQVSDIKFLISILAASLIHSASFIWIVLLVAKRLDIVKCIWFTLIANAMILFVVTPTNLAAVISIISKGAASRMNSYLSLEYQLSSWRHHSQILYVVASATFFFGLLFMAYRSKDKFNITNKTELVLKMNICILIIVSLMIKYTQEVYRLQEGLFVVNFIALSNIILKRDMLSSRKKISGFALEIGIVLYAFLSACYLLYLYLIPTVIYPLLHNNHFWDLFGG